MVHSSNIVNKFNYHNEIVKWRGVVVCGAMGPMFDSKYRQYLRVSPCLKNQTKPHRDRLRLL